MYSIASDSSKIRIRDNRLFLKFLKPPRSFVKVVMRRPVKIGPNGVIPPTTPEDNAYIAQEAAKALKQFRRKQIIYWAVVGSVITLTAIALWKFLLTKSGPAVTAQAPHKADVDLWLAREAERKRRETIWVFRPQITLQGWDDRQLLRPQTITVS